MSVICPNCESTQVDSINIARKTGTALGSAAGVATGLSTAAQSARLATSLSFLGGPVAMISTAVLAAIATGVAGGSLGSECGSFIDENLLDNFRCMNCNHQFSCTDEASL